jgi:hypothetical protein
MSGCHDVAWVNDEFTRRVAVGAERQVNSEGSATHISRQHMISAEAFASRALEYILSFC